MPDWLADAFTYTPLPALETILWRLIAAMLLGGGVGAIYCFTQRRGSPIVPSFVSTLVLLAILIAMVTQVVGDSIGRAFTLVGTLSIVRFRTVVEDTRDTAFVILAVVVGMAMGTGNLAAALVGLGIVGLAALLLRFVPDTTARSLEDWLLQVRIGAGFGDPPPWDGLFARFLHDVRLVGTSSARQGAAFDLSYKVRLNPDTTPLAFLKEMNRLEGIQNLELKRTGL